MTWTDWKKFLKAMFLIVLFAMTIGVAIGSCRGAAALVQRLMEGGP